MKPLWKRFGMIHIGIILFIEVFISLFLTLKYYFYADDYSMLYHLQNNITPQWPYEFVPLIYKPIYKLFGLATEPYAFLGVLTYFFVALLVYILNNFFLKNKLVSFFAAALFATGYIGLDQFTQLAVSTVNNLSNIFIIITLIIYLGFVQTKKKIYYALSLSIFVITMIVFPFRAFPLLLFMPTAHALLTLKLNLKLPNLKSLFFIIFLQFPFLIIAYFSGIFSYGSNPEAERIVPEFVFWKAIFVIITPEFLSEIPKIVGRLIIPDAFASSVFKMIITQEQYFIIGLLVIFISVFLGIYFFSHKTYQRFSRGVLFFLIMTIGGFIGNLILLPSFDSNGPINRYLNLSFIGYSGIFSIITYILVTNIIRKSKRAIFVYAIFMTIVIIIFLDQTVAYEKKIFSEKSIPSRNFFKKLSMLVPNISTKTILFFDYADYHPIYSRFGNIMVGAYLPREAALAVHYKKKLDLFKIPNSFKDFETEIKKSSNQKFYTFYYDEKGLQNTTRTTSNFFINGGANDILKTKKNNTEPFNPEIRILANDTPSLVPYKLNFSLRVLPLDSSIFNFPYSNLKIDDQIIKDYKTGKIDKNKIFEYLDSRTNYYAKASTTVSSSHVYGMHTAEFLIDDRQDTYWLDDQSSFAFGLKPWIEIDLGQVREIGKVLWVNESEPRFPKEFIIESSKDKKSWERVKVEKRERLSEASLVEIITVSPVNSRFIKLHILSTEAFEPGFSEIEAIDKKYTDVDLMSARRIKDNPFEFISDENDLLATYEFLKNNSLLTILTLTNKEYQISSTYDIKHPVFIDGVSHQYSIDVPPRGINLKEIIFKLPYPAKIEVSDISVEYLPIGN